MPVSRGSYIEVVALAPTLKRRYDEISSSDLAAAGVTIGVPPVILQTPALSLFEKLVYGHLLQFAEHGHSEPSAKDISVAMGRSYRAVSAGLSTLERFGLIRRWLVGYQILPLPTWLADTVRLGALPEDLFEVMPPAPFPYVRDDVDSYRQISVGGERAVAKTLRACGWTVGYRGSQLGAGYDIQGSLDHLRARVEVKTSAEGPIRFILMSAVEWRTAKRFGDSYFLALVDEYGSPLESIWLVQNPYSISDSPRIKREVLRPHAFRAADLLAAMIGA